MHIYLDESGDLGWTLDKPYRKGGSSRYLTLAFLIVPFELRHRPKNVMKWLYKKYGWIEEKKACHATLNQKVEFSSKVSHLLQRCPSIKIDVITVKKQNVASHIRSDSNKLYNYMSGLVIPEYVANESRIDFIPDERTVKTKSGNSLADYLQIKLWFDFQFPTVITNLPAVSKQNYNLQFIDWIANCIWIRFENGDESSYKILKNHLKIRQLFF